MNSTTNSYRNETHLQDLAALATERRLARSAARREPTQATLAARSLAATHQVALAVFVMLALAIALAVPVVAAPLV